MARDRIKALKFESPDTGGTETDAFPTGVDKNEDYYDGRGVTFQNATSNDEAVVAERDADDNLCFLDAVAGSRKLVELLKTESHKVLRQLIHFIDSGPAEGFASGAYRETVGTVFPTSIVWWESSGKTKKIVERTIGWTGVNPTSDQWKVYDTDGATVLATVTDAISYSGPFETSRTRTIAVS